MTQAIGFRHVVGLPTRREHGRGPVGDTRIGSTSLEPARRRSTCVWFSRSRRHRRCALPVLGRPPRSIRDAPPPSGLVILADYAAGTGVRRNPPLAINAQAMRAFASAKMTSKGGLRASIREPSDMPLFLTH